MSKAASSEERVAVRLVMVERHSSVPLSVAYPNAVQPDGNAAQPAVAADRFARKIVHFLWSPLGAPRPQLKRKTLGRSPIILVPYFSLV
jgi:hypothetical protein